MDFPQFPNNSHAAKIQSQEKSAEETEATSESTQAPEGSKAIDDAKASEKAPKKVIKGKASQRRKPLGTRVKDMFVNDGGSFGEYLVEKVVVPMMKDMVLSIITQTADGFRQGVEEKLFGESRPRTTRGVGYGTGRPVRINYSSYSSSPLGRAGRSEPDRVIRRSNRIQDIILETREDGDTVLEELDAIIDSVGHCTVGDLYSLVDIRPKSTDEGWGWDDLSQARVRKLSPNEFLLVMPRPIPIENG